MNDSFLEDLELIIPKDSKKASNHEQTDRYITTRHVISSPLLRFSDLEKNNVVPQQKVHSDIDTDVKITSNKELSKKSKKQPNQNEKRHSVKVKVVGKNDKIEAKVRSMDVKIKDNNRQQVISGETKIKLQETRHSKSPENKTVSKDHNRRSGSYKEIASNSTSTSIKRNRRSSDSSNNHSSDFSGKENSRPSDSSGENSSYDIIKESEKLSANLKKSGFNIKNQDLVTLLTAIKELISTYTKLESTKILRIMQELHINSQATLIKNLLYQTEDLIKEMHPSKDSARVKKLIEENEHLQQELIAMKTRNEDLQNQLEELEFLKQENAALKLKLM